MVLDMVLHIPDLLPAHIQLRLPYDFFDTCKMYAIKQFQRTVHVQRKSVIKWAHGATSVEAFNQHTCIDLLELDIQQCR